MDVNCDLLGQYLKRYAQTVDKPTGFISEVIKDALKKAAPYKNERAQWKSGIHKISFKEEDTFHDSFAALSVTEEELAQFHKNGTERLKSGMEQSAAKQKQDKIARPHQPIQKSLHNFGFKSSESNGNKRKMDSLNDNIPQANPKLKITDHREPNSSNWNPKNNWQSPHVSGESLGTSKFNPAAQIKSLMKPADTQGHFGMDQPVRKYALNPPPVKQQPNRSNSYENNAPNPGPFRSARDELAAQNIKKYGHPGAAASGPVKRSLGTRKGGIYGKFVPPKKISEDGGDMMDDSPEQNELEPLQDERLRNIDPKMVEMITNEIMYVGKPVEWDDIAGLEFAKTTIQEIVVWPLLRPDIFSGLRGPPKGILLFGPPGTGKTLIGKCIAAQSKSTFFSISASSLTSKWIGDGEKMVRALFAVARCHQPAVIFIDEIDSLLSQRSDSEHESSRRIKTEFLVQLDGATTAEDERILVVGATNRPQELDEAARRRLVKRLYIPLPEQEARAQMVRHLMGQQRYVLSDEDIQEVAGLAKGFSGADMRDLCREAAYGPIRSIDVRQMQHINPEQVRPVTLQDFRVALQQVRPSVSGKDLQSYEQWNKTYGYGNS